MWCCRRLDGNHQRLEAKTPTYQGQAKCHCLLVAWSRRPIRLAESPETRHPSRRKRLNPQMSARRRVWKRYDKTKIGEPAKDGYPMLALTNLTIKESSWLMLILSRQRSAKLAVSRSLSLIFTRRLPAVAATAPREPPTEAAFSCPQRALSPQSGLSKNTPISTFEPQAKAQARAM